MSNATFEGRHQPKFKGWTLIITKPVTRPSKLSHALLLAADDLVPLLLQRGDNGGVGLKIGITWSFSHNYHQLSRYPCFNLKIGIIWSFSQNYCQLPIMTSKISFDRTTKRTLKQLIDLMATQATP